MPCLYTCFLFLALLYPEIVTDGINNTGGKGNAKHQKKHIDKPAAGGINVLKNSKRTSHIGGNVEAVYLISKNEIEALRHNAGDIVDDNALEIRAAFLADPLAQVEIKTDKDQEHMPDIGVGSQGDNGVLNAAGL